MEARQSKLGWIAIAIGVMALFVAIGGRNHRGYHGGPGAYQAGPAGYAAGQEGYQGRGGWNGPQQYEQQNGPQQYEQQNGPQYQQNGPQQYQQNRPQRGWNGPQYQQDYQRFDGPPMFNRGHHGPGFPFFFLPFLIIGGIIKFVLFALLVALFLRWLGGRGPWGRGPGGRGPWGRGGPPWGRGGPWGPKGDKDPETPSDSAKPTSDRSYTGETQTL